MFAQLLGLCVMTSLVVCIITVLLFSSPLRRVLIKRASEDAALAWTRLIVCAVFVVGISYGVRVWDLERYVQAAESLSSNILVMEAYKSFIRTCQANIMTLVSVFLVIILVPTLKKHDAIQENE